MLLETLEGLSDCGCGRPNCGCGRQRATNENVNTNTIPIVLNFGTQEWNSRNPATIAPQRTLVLGPGTAPAWPTAQPAPAVVVTTPEQPAPAPQPTPAARPATPGRTPRPRRPAWDARTTVIRRPRVAGWQ